LRVLMRTMTLMPAAMATFVAADSIGPIGLLLM
jgi:hypothetical protein